jgi:hypothetical protein
MRNTRGTNRIHDATRTATIQRALLKAEWVDMIGRAFMEARGPRIPLGYRFGWDTEAKIAMENLNQMKIDNDAAQALWV